MYRIVTSLLYLPYAAIPVVLSFTYQHCQHNPQPAKILLLAALLELVISITAIQARKWKHRVLSTSRSTLSRSSAAAGATAKAWSQTAVQSGVQWIIPGVCCFLSSNVSFYALQRLPLHTYALLYSLRVVTTAVLANLLLQQKPNRQSRWSLLLLFAAVCIGQSATMGTHGRSSAAAGPTSRFTNTPPAGAAASITSWQQQQQQHGVQLEPTAATLLPGLAAVVAIAVLSSTASIHTEWMLSTPQKQAAAGEPLQLLSRASISCWAVALNGLLYWQYSSSSGVGSGDVGAGTALLSPVPATATAAAGDVPWGCAGGVRQWPAATLSPAPGLSHGSSSSSTPDPGFLSDLGPVHWVLVCLLAVAGMLGGLTGRRCQGSLHTACSSSLALLLTVSVSASPMLLQQLHRPQQLQQPLLFYVACCFTAAALLQLQRQQQQQHSCEVAAMGPPAAKQQHAALLLQQGASVLPAGRKGAGTGSVLHIPGSIIFSGMHWLLGAFSIISTSKASRSSSRVSSSSSSSSSNGARSRSSNSTQGLKGGPGSLPGVGFPGSWFPMGWQVAYWPAAFPGVSAELICWLLDVLDGLVVAAVVLSLLLLLTGSVPASSLAGGSSVYLQQGRLVRTASTLSAAAAAAAAGIQNTTNVPMPPELVSMPCSNGHWLERERFCPVVNCSLAADCSVSDPACCAHLNFQMLAYLDHLLSSRGLSQHYVIAYGTLLGAVRNKTILAHTNDVDVAMSAAAITLLEQRSTQLELWRHGYIFWCSDNVWRMCAHLHHPSPAFRRLMRPREQHALQGGPYVDAYLMWPTQSPAAAAVEAAAASLAAAAAVEAATAAPSRTDSQAEQQGQQQQEQKQEQEQAQGRQQQQQGLEHAQLPLLLPQPGASSFSLWGARRRHEWQLCFSTVPVKLSGQRRVWLEGLRVVVPDNAEQLLAGTYGPRWRTPNLRPYAPSYDEDECVDAVLRLNSTLF